MAHGAPVDEVPLDHIVRLSLQVGRLLLLNGAETEQVEAEVARFASSYGCQAQLMVSYEALLLTVVRDDVFRTKIGRRVPAMNVSLTAVGAVKRLVDEVVGRGLDLAQAQARLDAIEHQPPQYSRWLVVVALGLTAASLSRLFGGDWPTFAIAWLAGMAGTWLRQEMGPRGFSPILVPFAAACLGGVIGGASVRLGISATPALCLVAPAMIIVPGVPLINGVQDLVRNHMTSGISRLGFAGIVVLAIALGLFVATLATGVSIPVDAPSRFVAVPEDAVFSALAAVGYALLFNAPARLAWACVLCGVASHTTRTWLLHLGVDAVTGTLIGALVVGLLAQAFARAFDAPPAAFAFPGVVAMVPGAYAFRAVIGALRIAHAAATAPLLDETLALSLTVLLMVGAIAVGIAAPVLVFAPFLSRRNGER